MDQGGIRLCCLGLFCILLLASRSVFAQGNPVGIGSRPDQDVADVSHTWSFEPKESILLGSQHYFSSDTSLFVEHPRGFNLNASYYRYRSDISSPTATVYLGAGQRWDIGTLAFTYSVTPLSNNYRSHAVTATGDLNLGSLAYQTTLGVDFTVTYYSQLFISTQNARGTINAQTDIRQIAPMFHFSQKIKSTKLTLDFSKSTYDKEISRLANRINPVNATLQGVAGLLQGFPDMEWKCGVFHSLRAWPVRAWATYDHIRLLLATSSTAGASDSYTLGTDLDVGKNWSTTLKYNYVTQTGEAPTKYAGISLSLYL